MMGLHDNFYGMNHQVCTLTERGQVSLPAALRRQLRLKPGQRLRWECVSETEMRVVVESANVDPVKALGFGPKFRRGGARRTSDWMQELRAGE